MKQLFALKIQIVKKEFHLFLYIPRDKLEMQLRETEHLKQELTKSKESASFSRLDDSDIPSIYKLVEFNAFS